MNEIVQNYIDTLKIIYNGADDCTLVIDTQGNILYLSEGFHKLLCKDTQYMPASFKDFDRIPEEIRAKFESLHNKTISNKKPLDCLCLLEEDQLAEFTLFHGDHNLIYSSDGNPPIAVFACYRRVNSKAIIMDNMNNNHEDYCFEIPNSFTRDKDYKYSNISLSTLHYLDLDMLL